MKLMLCEECGDIVAPSRTDFKVRWCDCGRHAIWWENGAAGNLVLHDKAAGKATPGSIYDGFPVGGPRAWVLGIHNGALTEDLNPSVVALMITCAKGYIFEKTGSLIARFRPLATNDTRWSSKLP
jgi:hypothetical protein